MITTFITFNFCTLLPMILQATGKKFFIPKLSKKFFKNPKRLLTIFCDLNFVCAKDILDMLTSCLHSAEVPIHCLQWRNAVNPSLNPPKALLAGLSADTAAMVP